MSLLPLIQLLVLASLLGSAVFWDLKESRIPNAVTAPGLMAGLLLAGLVAKGVPGSALAGAAIALALSFPFVAMGFLGAGDAKLLTAVGAFVGAGGLLSVFIFGGIAGGILGIANTIRRRAFLGVMVNIKNLLLYQITLGRHGERIRLDSPGAQTVPYGLAIAAGALATWFFPLSLGGSL
jgi:prepilin peptidase CpaA